MNTIINEADVIIITAGAGMGHDSGLPTFRGDAGFWKAYPVLKNKKINFMSIANPAQFNPTSKNLNLAWAFYGHRYNMYMNTTPHIGFDALLNLVKSKKDYFVVTSNVDGHFQKAGFDANKVYEIHGRIKTFQCTCCNKVWTPDPMTFDIDQDNMIFKSDIPKCPSCNNIARPNIMMFGDYTFNSAETLKQEQDFNTFMRKYDKDGTKIIIIEIGAGTAIPSIRILGENIQDKVASATLIRINPSESFGPKGIISIDKGAVEALKELIPECF